jgi:ABC-type bacteriocin/lantibiotic exporter with double-glycine peptidase domain
VQIIVYLSLLYYYIGWSTFAGLGAMFVLAPPIIITFSIVIRALGKIAEVTDSRINATNEVLLGMEGVKMAAWEESFVASIEALRIKEIGFLKKIQYTIAVGMAIIDAAPAFIATR